MTLIIDPSEIAQPGRVELDLLSDTIYAKPEGIDWGDTALENYKAQQTYGEAIVDWRLPNRVVTIPLIVRGRPEGESMIEAMGRLQAKVARLATEGGALKRVRGGLTMYADIETAHMVLPDTWTGKHRDFETEGQLVLECRPDFYGAEKTEDAVTGGDGLVIFTLSDVEGSYPARCEVIVTDEDSVNHNGVLLGFREEDTAATAELMYEAEDLEALSGATVVTQTGASGGASNNAVQLTGIRMGWTSHLRFRVGGTTNLTHKGAYRVWARTYTDSADIQFRLAWAVNNLDLYTFEPGQPSPGPAQWQMVDLGVVRLKESPAGSHRWDGIIQTRDTSDSAGGSTAVIDRIELQPTDDYPSRITTPPSGPAPLSWDLVLFDPMEHGAGNLTGKTLSGVGTYTVHPSLSAAGDFVVDTAGDFVHREEEGKRAVGFAAGVVSEKDVRVSARMRYDGSGGQLGLIVRAEDASNYLLLDLISGPTVICRLRIYASGNPTNIGIGSFPMPKNTWFQILMEVVGDVASLLVDGSHVGTVQHSLIGDAGAGGVYIYSDVGDSSTAHDFTDLKLESIADAPVPALIYPDRSLSATSLGAYRESEDGGAWSKVQPYGSLPRLPVSGAEGRGIEVFCRVSAGDFEGSGDNDLRSPSVQVKYRPCWSSVPEEISAGGSGSGSGSGA